jgi:hypothetical protein
VLLAENLLFCERHTHFIEEISSVGRSMALPPEPVGLRGHGLVISLGAWTGIAGVASAAALLCSCHSVRVFSWDRDAFSLTLLSPGAASLALRCPRPDLRSDQDVRFGRSRVLSTPRRHQE